MSVFVIIYYLFLSFPVGMSSDYQEFVPHLAGSSGGCLFGYKETFYRRKDHNLLVCCNIRVGE